MLEKALPGKVTNVMRIRRAEENIWQFFQCRKTVHTDEGKQRQAALLAFSAFPELKHVILVDEDVDIFDTRDVLWAMNTRFQGDRDIITIPGVRCHPLDPSSDPAYSQSISDKGISCKTIFDCTVPFELKYKFCTGENLWILMRKSGRTLFDMKKILVGISGASGASIAIRLLKRLREMADAETHLIMTKGQNLPLPRKRIVQ